MAAKQVETTVYLPPDLHARVRQETFRLRCSISRYIRVAVERLLANPPQELPKEAPDDHDE